MLMPHFEASDLRFAWSNRVYMRFQTHLRKTNTNLARMTSDHLRNLLETFDIHVLEFKPSERELRLMISLHPNESLSVVVSKLKGRVSKWLNTQADAASPLPQLAKGYFAVTTGKSTASEVDNYLEVQPIHHHYDTRPHPPVFVSSFSRDEAAKEILRTDHAVTFLRYHLVLSTEYRQGIFESRSGEEVANHWISLQHKVKFVLDKVSFLPDHVHVAVQVHPTVNLASLIRDLMNSAQSVMAAKYLQNLIRAKVKRLWQPTSYIGAYGDLRSSAIAEYVRNWESGN